MAPYAHVLQIEKKVAPYAHALKIEKKVAPYAHVYKFYTYMQEGISTQSLWVNRKDIHKPVRYIAESINVNVSVVNFKIYHPSPPTDPDEFVVPLSRKSTPNC